MIKLKRLQIGILETIEPLHLVVLRAGKRGDDDVGALDDAAFGVGQLLGPRSPRPAPLTRRHATPTS